MAFKVVPISHEGVTTYRIWNETMECYYGKHGAPAQYTKRGKAERRCRDCNAKWNTRVERKRASQLGTLLRDSYDILKTTRD